MQQGSSSSRLFLVSFFFFSSFAASSSAFFEITVVHTNDLHSRFDQIISRGSECTEADARAKKCYGGVARIKKAVEDVRREQDQDALFLNAGDFFQARLNERDLLEFHRHHKRQQNKPATAAASHFFPKSNWPQTEEERSVALSRKAERLSAERSACHS